MQIKIKKLREDAKLPTHGHPGDAGMDFYCIEDVIFAPGKQERVPTGIAVEIPEGHVGLIWDKSSISFNLGLKVFGGVIDSGYRGEIIMCLLNTSNKEVVLEKEIGNLNLNKKLKNAVIAGVIGSDLAISQAA